MALRYPVIAWIGIPLVIIIMVLIHMLKKKSLYRGGIKAANSRFFRMMPEYRKMKQVRAVLALFLEAAILVSLIMSVILLARPSKTEVTVSGTKKRDILLCLDVSYSICYLNYDLVESLKEVVKGLEGDRFGISIFNTSTVLYVPMTDDYDYIVTKLDELKEYFRLQQIYMDRFVDDDMYVRVSAGEEDEYYALQKQLDYYDAGTLVRNRFKGSSLIGEGLASGIYSFPKLDDEARTRVIIMATDNAEEARGTPIIELDEAADLCREHDIKIFGIFPDEETFNIGKNVGYEEHLKQMKEDVELTGGIFYEQSKSLTVEDIVKDIEHEEAKVVNELSITKVVDKPSVFVIILLISLFVVLTAGVGLIL